MLKYCDRCYELALTRVYEHRLPNAKICYSKECAFGRKAKNRPRVLYRAKLGKYEEYSILTS